MGGDAAVADGVACVGDVGVEAWVADVDGVVAGLGHLGRPACGGGASAVGLRLGDACRSLLVGVLSVEIDLAQVGEAGSGLLPLLLSVPFLVDAVAVGMVVVDDDLLTHPAALAGCPDDGSGALEHGVDEGDGEGLREDVLDGAEDGGALPGPLALGDVEVAAVAGTEAEVAALESACDGVGEAGVAHPGIAAVLGACPVGLLDEGSVGLGVEGVGHGLGGGAEGKEGEGNGQEKAH